MNSFNRALGNAIASAIRDIEGDDQVLVAILSSEGGRAFSTGSDLKEMRQIDRTENTLAWTSQTSFYTVVKECRKPIIAAVDGYAIAGGLELALCCDIRVATESSLFGMPEPRSSLLGNYGLHNLSRMLPLGESLLIQLTGMRINAQRAYEVGMIQALARDRKQMLDIADSVADAILARSPKDIRRLKQIIKVAHHNPGHFADAFEEAMTGL